MSSIIVDLHSACPLSGKNRMIFCSDFNGKNLDGSDSELAKKWDKLNKPRYEETKTIDGVSVKYTSTVSNLKNSPAYGIAAATQTKA
jgi:hypothetical protein